MDNAIFQPFLHNIVFYRAHEVFHIFFLYDSSLSEVKVKHFTRARLIAKLLLTKMFPEHFMCSDLFWFLGKNADVIVFYS